MAKKSLKDDISIKVGKSPKSVKRAYLQNFYEAEAYKWQGSFLQPKTKEVLL